MRFHPVSETSIRHRTQPKVVHPDHSRLRLGGARRIMGKNGKIARRLAGHVEPPIGIGVLGPLDGAGGVDGAGVGVGVALATTVTEAFISGCTAQ